MKQTALFVAMLVMFVGPGLAQQPGAGETRRWFGASTFEEGLTIYKGIPFAAPPVGDLLMARTATAWRARSHQVRSAPIQADPVERVRTASIRISGHRRNPRLTAFLVLVGGGFGGGSA